MDLLSSLGPDSLLNVVSFSAGAEVVGLLKVDRKTHSTITGSSARKHFRAASVSRWGSGCHLAAGNEGDWFQFYLRRIGHRSPARSPCNLIQERHAEDAYHLLSCCILCSRTSGKETVRDAVAKFFEACPTPTSVVDADQAHLRQILLPLGLNREVIVKRFAEGYLTTEWFEPSELYGCGAFASDSWKIFCLGKQPKSLANVDRNLARYCCSVVKLKAWNGGDKRGEKEDLEKGVNESSSMVSGSRTGIKTSTKRRKSNRTKNESIEKDAKVPARRSARLAVPSIDGTPPREASSVSDRKCRIHIIANNRRGVSSHKTKAREDASGKKSSRSGGEPFPTRAERRVADRGGVAAGIVDGDRMNKRARKLMS